MDVVRQKLHLDQAPWLQLPDDLLRIAFRQPNAKLSAAEKKRLEDKYGSFDLKQFEYVGDSVLDLIATDILFEQNVGEPKVMSRMGQELVRNTTFYCFLADADLLQYSEGPGAAIKDYANIFEAVIGVLHYYLTYIVNEKIDRLEVLQSYLEQWWFTPEVLDRVYKQMPLGQCLVDGQTAASRGNNYNVRKVTPRPAPKAKAKSKKSNGAAGSAPTPALLPYLTAPFSIDIPEEPLYVDWATRNAVYYETQDPGWTLPYEIRLQVGEDPYQVLEDLYALLRLDLEDNTFLVEDWAEPAVLIQALNFQTLTLEAEEIGSGATLEEAKSQAAEEVLAGIFEYFRSEE